MQYYGGNPMQVLHSKNSFEVLIQQAIAQRVQKIRYEHDKSLANDIANAVARMLGAEG